MRKLNVRFLSALLAVAMLISIAPSLTFATATDPLTDAEKALYTGKIVDWTFDDLAEQTLTGVSNAATATGTNGTYNFYLPTDKTATIASETDKGNVLKIITTPAKTPYVGVADSVFSDYNTANGTPTKFKVEFETCFEESWKVLYVQMSGTDILRRDGNNKQFVPCNGGTLSDPIDGTYENTDWVKTTLYLDTEADTCAIYLNDIYVANHENLPTSVKNGLTSLRFTTNGTSKPIKVDNIKVYAYEELDIVSTTPANSATGIEPNTNVTLTFSHDLAEVNNFMIAVDTITGEAGSEVITPYAGNFTVSKDGKVLTVDFENDLAFNTKYRVTAKSTIEGESGAKFVGLTDKIATTFTTKSESTSGGSTGPITDAEKALYTGKVVDWTFDDVSADFLTGGTGDTVTYGDDVYYISEGKTADIVSVDGHGKVLQFATSTAKDIYVGVPNSVFTDYNTANGTPTKFKVEFETCFEESWKVLYVQMSGTDILRRDGNNKQFVPCNGGTLSDPIDGTYENTDWVKTTLYLDTEADTCAIYLNGIYIANHDNLPTNVKNGLTGLRFTANASATVQVDNIKVYAYEALANETLDIESTTPTDAANDVEPSLASYTATFNKDLGNVTNGMVTIESTDGGTIPTHAATVSGKNLTVNFTGGFTAGKTYKITFSGTIPNVDGTKTLGTAVTKTFTIKSEGSSGGGTGGDNTGGDNTGGDDDDDGSDTTTPGIKEIGAKKIFDWDFDELTEGDSYTGGSNNNVKIGDETLFLTNNKTVTVVPDSEEGSSGNVLQMTETAAKSTGVGVPEVAFENYKAANGGVAPKKVKVEMSFSKRTSGKVIYLNINGQDGTTTYEWGRWNNSNQFTFANASAYNGVSLPDTFSNDWIDLTLYFDFDAGCYHIYINGVYQTTATTRSNDELKTILIGTNASTSSTIEIDDIKVYAYDVFKFEGTAPANDATNISVTDDVEFTFSDELGSVDKSKVEIRVGETETILSADKYNTLVAGKKLIVNFTEALELGKKYKVTVKGDAVTDKNGWPLDGKVTVGETVYTGVPGQTADDMILTFTTTNESKLYVGNPVFKDGKVTAKVVNYTDVPKSATLMVAEFNEDGSVTMHTGANGSVTNLTNDVKTLEVDFDPANLSDTEKAVAFIIDGNKQELFSDAVVNSDNTLLESSATGAVTLDTAQLSGDILTVSGTLSTVGKCNLAIKITKDGSLAMVVPVQTGADGKFSQDIKLNVFGEFYVSLIGFNMTESTIKSIYYMSAEEKGKIKDAINGAATAEAMQAVLNNTNYKVDDVTYIDIKNMMRLDGKYLNTCTYSTLCDQRPFASYDAAVEMIYDAYELLDKVNNTEWSGYTNLLLDNSDIILKTSTKLSVYKGHELTDKEAINKVILGGESYPFVDFRALSAAFDKAVGDYVVPGSGGGGTNGGGVTDDTPSKPSIIAPGNVTVSPAPGGSGLAAPLFTDLHKASWASASVNRLHSMGIISPDTEFRPLDNVKREEFVKMLVQLVGIKVDGKKSTFTDAKANEWYSPYLGAAQSAGIIKGSDDGTFGVGKNISRQDMVVMAQRAIAVMNKTVKTVKEAEEFADSNTISDYAQAAVEEMQKAGVISGMGDGNFAPTETANRAQAAVVISNLIDAME